MRHSFALLGLAALAVASDVHDLTKDTFDPFLKDHPLVLAEFFAPWCGHCKALAPEYEEAATTLKEKAIPLAKIDCTEQQDLCQQQGIDGYPTLRVFRGAENSAPYSGARKAPAIISYMTKQALPAVSLLESATALDEFKTADNVVLVGFFGADDKSSNATYLEVAESLRDDYLFAATSDAALAKAEGVTPPAVVLYKSFDEGKATFEEKFDTDALAHFARTGATPLIGEVGPETYAGYMASGIPLAYIFSESAEERKSLADLLRPVAKLHKGVVNFATIDAQAFGQHAGNLNLEIGKWPAFAIQDTTKNLKFPFAQAGDVKALTEKTIGAFLTDYVAGKVEPSIKSEPIPEKQEGPVTVVVAKNYDELVINNDKDVLLEFYAPWCGHCKALAPKYEELAALYKNHADKVIVAKVDATLNDVPDEIAGFPTIKLFRAKNKSEPLEYSGGRTVEDLANFIKENGSHGVAAQVHDDSAEDLDTDAMPNQAPAATETAETVGEKIKEKVVEAAEAAKDAIVDSEGMDDHDEL
ncbi:thioredoxin-like protein [Neohortaea acidophila]|uniref:Protein disulfide-isomerase n=1 Tax=Neohortaea acidophila TaxID=245834 RepID=A0A6A6PRE6_9PEZI|nr:thioredoxin-like protein [Neohortaea acidophila]KAF2481787.1 thioredoxin-like protein [Neohortaea acidophila]